MALRRRHIVIALSMLLLPAIALTLLIYTNVGARLILAIAPAQFEAGAVAGSIGSQLRLDDVRVTTATGELRVDHAELRIELWPLLRRHLSLPRLQLRGVVLQPAELTTPTTQTVGARDDADDSAASAWTFEFPDVEIIAVSVGRPDERLALIDHAAGSLRHDAAGTRFEDISLTWADGSASGSMQLDATQGGVARGRFDLSAVTPAGQPFTAMLVLAGSVDQATLSGELSGALEARIDLRGHDLLGDPRFDGVLTLIRLDAATLMPGWPRADVSGTVELAASRSAFSVNAALRDPGSMPAGMSLVGDGTISGSSVVLRNLALGAQDRDDRITVSGRLDLDGYRTDLHGTWHALHSPDGILLSPEGSFQVSGPPSALRFELDAAMAPGSLGHLSAQGSADLFAQRFSAEGAWRDLVVPGLDETPDGRFTAHGDTHTIEVSVTAGTEPDATGIDGAATVTMDDPAIALAGSLSWRSLRALDGRLTSTAGELRFEGDTGAVAVELSGDLLAAGAPPAQLTASFTATQTGIDASRLELQVLDGRIEGHGALRTDGGGLEIALTASDLDPSTFWPMPAGRVGGRISVIARDPLHASDWRITLAELHGDVDGRAVSGSGALLSGDDGLTLRDLVLDIGTNRLTATGAISPAWSLRWTLHAPQFGALIDGASGSVEAHGVLTGSDTVPGGSAEFALTEASYLGIGAASGTGSVTATRFNGVPDTLLLTLTGASFADGERADAQIDLRRDGDRHRGELGLTGEGWRLHAAALGVAEAGSWRGEISNLSFEGIDGEVWRSAAAAPLHADASGISLGRSCLQLRSATGCVSFDWPAGSDWRLAATLADLRLENLPRFAAGVMQSGRVDGALQLSGSAAPATGRLSLRGDGLRLATRTGDGVEDLLTLGSAVAEVVLADDQQTTHLQLSGTDGSTLDATLRSPVSGGRLVLDAPIVGRLDAGWRDLSIAPLLFTEVGRANGVLEFALDVAGSLNRPTLTGEISLADGGATIPSLGITLTEIALGLAATETGLRLTGRAHSGGGELVIDADLDPDQRHLRGTATVTGNGFQAVSLQAADVRISPDLLLTMDGADVALQGSLRIGPARITPDRFAAPIRVSSDQRIVGVEAPTGDGDRISLRTDLRVEFGDDVRIEGEPLRARLQGSLMVHDRPGQITTADGQLDLGDGTYLAFGRQLTIEHGRLLFTGGALADPGLDVRAVRAEDTVGESVRVGVDVRGTLRNPVLRLFSTPPMPQAQIVSHLLTGRGLADLEPDQEALVASARSTLALESGNLLAAQLSRRLGQNEVNIRPGEEIERTEIELGRWLSPRLYVSYGVGLFESFESYRMRYLISQHWSLLTVSSLEDSVDLQYSVER